MSDDLSPSVTTGVAIIYSHDVFGISSVVWAFEEVTVEDLQLLFACVRHFIDLDESFRFEICLTNKDLFVDIVSGITIHPQITMTHITSDELELLVKEREVTDAILGFNIEEQQS